ncbi:GlxA family transcriptional regulator [Actinospica robiniae]|uniref:GlxA family transcriptional regulator n=1 Tax=Actinospica robiniae TaxID=304901 RepID=UPI000427EDD1|nr:helix-turn-helix domain-containing protein [Actinospica robiniae]
MPLRHRPHHVVVLALPGVLALDYGIPVQVFGSWAGGPYELTVCSQEPGPVPCDAGPALYVEHGLEALADADTVIIPGLAHEERPTPEVLEALAAAAARGTRMVSICSGAFVLAAAGLLDGRRATTHWAKAAELAEYYPAVTVEEDVLYVDEGEVLTSAGVAAGLDLCLHIIRSDHGAAAANQRARGLVAAPHRTGGQAQYIDRAVPATSGDTLADLRGWLLGHLEEPQSLDQMARRAGVSRRTLSRRFLEETGRPPAGWLLDVRLTRARELLETSDAPMETVARLAGLGTPANLRVLFNRHVGTAPSTYRATFRRTASIS